MGSGEKPISPYQEVQKPQIALFFISYQAAQKQLLRVSLEQGIFKPADSAEDSNWGLAIDQKFDISKRHSKDWSAKMRN
jgi:hypothetical protein